MDTPTASRPGERFAYNNAGSVVLAILAERAAGTRFDPVQQRICDPSTMTDTANPRSDALRERTALDYLDAQSHQSNVLHLPVQGSGDGRAYTTVAEIRRLRTALQSGAVLDRGPADPHSAALTMRQPGRLNRNIRRNERWAAAAVVADDASPCLAQP